MKISSIMPCWGGRAVGDASVPDFEGIEAIAWRMRIILPNSRFRVVWDWWIVLLVLYSSIAIPIEFGYTYYTPIGLQAWGYLVDLLFITDMIFNLDTAYTRQDGTLELDRKKIVIHYLLGWKLMGAFSID